MLVFDNYNRYKIYEDYSHELNKPYNYERYGLLNRLMSHKISESKSPVLRPMYMFYEKSLIFLLKQVDVIKHYKDIVWKNR